MSSLPRVGETRCYWVLLDAGLNFVYVDPVLAYHLEEQADALISRSLLEFVHPDEQSSAKQDLGSVLDSKTLHGSVTRVRFSRLSRIRRMLGHLGPPAVWHDAEKIALDSNYMAVDIVINWAAEGLVLCFIHAVVDLDPKQDNDEHNKTGWTNWCGTPAMSQDQITLLYRRLVMCIAQSGGMTRVFQILSNQPERVLLLSWPPDQNHGATGRDFAGLVEQVQIGTGAHASNDAKTSCTRRYKATQQMPPNVGGQVESIFIPHGSVIFACHKLTPRPSPPPVGYNESYPTYANTSYYPPPQHAWPPPGAPDMSYPNWEEYPQSTLPRPVTPHSYPASEAGGESPGDVVPPSRRRVSSESSNAPKEGGRQASNRPAGILMCSSCKATTSPEWRKGPSGKKELCNACGLRYARSRAKKDGQNQAQRKKKEKNVLAAAAAAARRDSVTPPTSTSSSASYRRDESLYSPVDIYRSHHMNDGSPSPSPSSYSSYSDNRPPFAPIPHHHSFYSGPSPLSNPPMTDIPSSYERGSNVRDGR